MARCDKCLMDPCLCGTPGFGRNEEENTTEKDIKELMGRRVIVKILPEYTELLKKAAEVADPAAQNFLYDSIEHRLTDVTGKIDRIGLAVVNQAGLPVFYIVYDNPPSKENAGHWYFDEELIYI